MYLPKHFLEDNFLAIKQLIQQNSFAILLSYPEGEKPFINHLPMIFSSNPQEDKVLIGHMSKKNPQWEHFKNNSNGTVIINGCHTYISPKWYKSGRDVPTWNYAVAHLYGKVDLIESFNEQIEILKQLSYFFESPSPNPWKFELPEDLKSESTLTSAIISFKFHIEKVDAKFKISQNRSEADRKGIIEGLLEKNDDMSKSIRYLMVENERKLNKI